MFLRLASLAAALLLAAGAGAGPRPADGAAMQSADADGRIARVEQWLTALIRHEPGIKDESLMNVGSWSTADIRTLWIDASVLVQLIRDPGRSSFSVAVEGERRQSIRYALPALRRLRVLACGAGGIASTPACLAMHARDELAGDLLRLSRLADASRARGDGNFVQRRGALLHTDIAMLMPVVAEPIEAERSAGPQRIRILTADGLQQDLGQVPPHWEFARMLLDDVRPPGAANPAPGLDDMVRLWYRATAAWMQAREQHDTEHLDHARVLFPRDADILFLSACQHETYAGPSIQSVLEWAVVPTGIRSDVLGARTELRQAETLFRRAIVADASTAETHVRYGHVLWLLDRHAEAIAELRRALADTDDGLLRYYAALFLGAALESAREFDAAHEAYAEAAELFPAAQSPRIALSALARRRGDRGAALRELEPLFAAPSVEGDDPWWRYFVVQARNADDLLDELRRPFLADTVQ